MKFLHFLLLFVSTISFAQPDGYSVDDIGQTHYSICSSKKNVGIYSKAKGDFLDPVHKGYVLHFPQTQFLLDVYPKEEKVILYHYYGGNIQKIEEENDTSVFLFGHILGDDWDSKLLSQAFSSKYKNGPQNVTLICSDLSDEMNDNNQSILSYSFSASFLNINFYHNNTRQTTWTEIKSISYPNEDSIDVDGNIVYYPVEERVITNSGCFNLKTGKWEIPPKYQAIKEWEGIYAGYYWPEYITGNDFRDVDKELKGTGIVYDFYKLEGKNIVPTQFQKRQKFTFPLELWPFEDEGVWFDRDSIYIYHEGKKGVGLYEIPLGGKYCYEGYNLDWFATDGRFDATELLEPKYRNVFITGNINVMQSPNENKSLYVLAAKGDDLFDVLFINEWRDRSEKWKIDTLVKDVTITSTISVFVADFWINDTTTLEAQEPIAVIDGKHVIRFCPLNGEIPDHTRWVTAKPGFEEGSSMYKTWTMDDEIFVVTANVFEDKSDWVPLRSVLDPWLDSIDSNGEMLYYPPDPGLYNSGIFDGKTNEWLLAPDNIQVFPSNGGYLVEKPELTEFGNLKFAYFDLLMPGGSKLFENIPHTKFETAKYDKYKIEGYEIKGLNYIGPEENRRAYFFTDEGVGAVTFNNYTANIMVRPSEMVKFAPNSTSVYLKNDTVYYKVNGSKNSQIKAVQLAIPVDSSVHVKVSGYYAERIRGEVDRYSRVDENYYVPQQISLEIKDSTGNKAYEVTNYQNSYGFAVDTIQLVGTIKEDPRLVENPFNRVEIGTGDGDWEFEFMTFAKRYIYVKDNKGDEEFQMAIPSRMNWEQDSLDAKGNVVYFPLTPGYCSSGVYDIKINDWLIRPEVTAVEWMCDSIFLVRAPLRNPKTGLKYGSEYFLQSGKKITPLKSAITAEDKSRSVLELESFKVGKINDSLFYVTDYIADQKKVPLMSSSYLDSLDLMGNIVYAKDAKGQWKSGIYNVLTNEWFIPNAQHKIYLSANFFIVSSPHFKENGFVDYFTYSVYEMDGYLLKSEYLVENLNDEELRVLNQ